MANLSTAVVESMRPRFALKWVIVAAVVIGAFVGLNYASKQLNWEPIVYARIVGFGLGLLAGLIVLVSVPLRWQALFAGSALGISAEEFANGAASGSTIPSGANAASVLASLGKFVKGLTDALLANWPDIGLPPPTEAAVTAGVWVFVLTLGLIMVVGTFQADAT